MSKASYTAFLCMMLFLLINKMKYCIHMVTALLHEPRHCYRADTKCMNIVTLKFYSMYIYCAAISAYYRL